MTKTVKQLYDAGPATSIASTTILYAVETPYGAGDDRPIDGAVLAEFVQDTMSTTLAAGTGLAWTYDDIANKLTGNVSLAPFSTTNLVEGTNLYYTQARFDTAFAAKTTTNLAEGTNLYYTDERVDDRAAALIQNGTGLAWTYDDLLGTLTGNVSLAPFSTTNLVEGTNLYYTQARFDTAFAAKGAVLETRNVNTAGGLQGGGALSADRTLSLTDTGVVAGSYTNTDLTIDSKGRITAAANGAGGGGGGGSTTFTGLTDTPANYVGAGGQGLRVNAGATAVEFFPLTTTNLAEGTNLYYTDERVDDRAAALIQNGTGLAWTYDDIANTLTGNVSLAPFSTTNLAEGTNLYYTQARFDTAFAAKTTTNLAEGTNLYYTDERVDDRAAALIQNGTGLAWTYDDIANKLTGNVSLASFSTTNLVEGTNLYYTQARFDAAFAAKTTTNLAEGTNLYYTDERAQDAVGLMAANSARVTLTYNDLTPSLTPDLVTNSIAPSYLTFTGTAKLAGRATAGPGAGAGEEIDITGGLETAGPTIRVGAFTGDVTKSAGGTVLTVANNAVTNDKLANVATATFKGRTSAGTGIPEDMSVAQALALLGIPSGGGAFQTYEIGNWTPSFSFAVPGDLTLAFTEQTGTFVRLGNMCIITFDVAITPSYTTASGNFAITGFPFVPDVGGGGVSFINIANFNSVTTYPTGRTQLAGQIINGLTNIFPTTFGSGVGAANLTTANVPSGLKHRFRGGGSIRIIEP